MHETPSGRFIRLPRKAYAELVAKAKAHDQYLAATKKMRERQAELLAPPPARDPEKEPRDEGGRPLGMYDYFDLSPADAKRVDEYYGPPRPPASWYRGWLDCLREFSEAVVNAGMEDAPFE